MMKRMTKNKKMFLTALVAGVMSFGIMGSDVTLAATPAKTLATASQMQRSSIRAC